MLREAHRRDKPDTISFTDANMLLTKPFWFINTSCVVILTCHYRCHAQNGAGMWWFRRAFGKK